MNTLVSRMIRAAKLDSSLFEELINDPSTQGQSVWVVAIFAMATGYGMFSRAGVTAVNSCLVTTFFGWYFWAFTLYFVSTYLFRNTGLALSMLLLVLIGLLNPAGNIGLILWGITAAVITMTALVGRALFYALVIPTTMPGGFFWRNKGFEEHARETGLAEMPQAGVLPNCH